MRPLSAAELLRIWEEGQGLSPARQALLLLAAACPSTPAERLAELSIGRRDAHLLSLREWTFGPRLECVVGCPQCREQLELAFDVADVRVAGPGDGEGDEAGTLSLGVEGYEVRFRLPNSLDVLATIEGGSEGTARQRLLERCLVAARHGEQERTLEQLPAGVLEALTEQMAQADPQADVQLALQCPACGHHWQATFDIASFLWSELSTWGRRLLYEVHTLARAYGWREADILAMSAWRRQCYLEMVDG